MSFHEGIPYRNPVYRMASSTCTVTVGTTQFETLVRDTLSANPLPFAQVLKRLEISKLVLQFGKGSKPSTEFVRALEECGIEVHACRFVPDMSQVISASDVVISHAGAGSILEALRAPRCKLLVVVVNRALMDDHQTEIAFALHEQGLLLAVDCADLIPRLSEARLDGSPRKLFPDPNTEAFVRMMSEDLGIE